MKSRNGKLEVFAEWLATPEEERQPGTMPEFSELHGVPMPTLYRWRAKLQKGPDADEADAFMDRLYKLAMSGKNARYADLWAKIKGMIPDGRSPQPRDISITADDLVRLEREAQQELKEQGYSSLGACDLCHQSGRLTRSYYKVVNGHLVEWDKPSE